MPIKISDEDYLNLSESEKHVIDYLNDHEKELSDLSITMIAARTYTSLATVSRAIRKCGYNGISELRYSLQQRQPLYSPDSLSVNDILTQSLRECTRTIDNISKADLEELEAAPKMTKDTALAVYRYFHAHEEV